MEWSITCKLSYDETAKKALKLYHACLLLRVGLTRACACYNFLRHFMYRVGSQYTLEIFL